MDLYTLDFETYYGPDYTLSSMTTEAYIRDPRFETILCGFKRNDEPGYWVDGPDVPRELDRIGVHNCAVLAHHAHFDGLILSHHYGQYPKVWFDTLSMARAVLGGKAGLSLAKLAERLGIGVKGKAVLQARGLRRRDFTRSFLYEYGEYCVNDCDLEYDVFGKLFPHFQQGELKLIDMTIRMFTEPRITLNSAVLTEHLRRVQADKLTALLRAGIQLTDVRSDAKFALALEALGVDPPTKISPTTGKVAFAFAKTDPQMEELAEHPDEDVQALIAARLKNKTTIEESRTIRMLDMATRHTAPVYLKYYGADQTGRHCLTGDTEITVLRDGVVLDILLPSLLLHDLVWDGEEFVPHGGLIDQGEREVVTYGGLTGTPDHRIYVEEQHGEIELSEAMQRGYTPKVGMRPRADHPGIGAVGRVDKGESPSTM